MALFVLSDLDFNNAARVINLPNPTLAQHSATKAYVDSTVEGLAWKDSARVATQANINLAAPGASVDGISMVASDRVVVRAQTAAPTNGIYLWNGASTPMTRSPDASTSAELEQAVVTIEEGTSAGSTLRQSSVNFTLETNDVIWASFGTAAPNASETGAGIAEIATQAETEAGTDDARFVTPLKLANITTRVRKFAANVGDGSATQFDLTHNFATRDVLVEVVRVSAPYDTIVCDVSRFDLNTVRLNFITPPTAGQFRALVRS